MSSKSKAARKRAEAESAADAADSKPAEVSQPSPEVSESAAAAADQPSTSNSQDGESPVETKSNVAAAPEAAEAAPSASATVPSEAIPVPPSPMEAAGAAAAVDESKAAAALEAAKGVTQDTALLQRANVYQAVKTEGILALQAWHEKLLNFFTQQRAPYLQKLDNIQLRVKNGEAALIEAKRLLAFLAEVHASYAKHLQAVSLFGTPLERLPNRPTEATTTAGGAHPPPPPPPPPASDRRPSVPTSASGQPVPPAALAANLTVPSHATGLGMEIPLPEGATVDPSALSLAVLAGFTYQQADKTRVMSEQIKQTIATVTMLQKTYANRANSDINQMRDLVQQCEKAAKEVDQIFKTHLEIYGYYSRALSPAPASPTGKGQQETPSQVLTAPSRKDLWRSEQIYRERVVALTKLHETFFTQCSQLLEDMSAAEQQRALKLHAIISDTIARYDQYFGALHRTNASAATETQQCLIVANRNHSVLKQLQQAQLAAQLGSQEAKVAPAPPPGPFPPNLNIVLAGPAERRTSILKNWTPVYLVLTKDNFLYCYAGEDVDTSAEVDKLLGTQPGLPAGTLITTSDPRQARLVLKPGRSVESNELWIADLYHTVAVPGEGRPEDESPNRAGLGFLFTLRVTPPGFFSRNWSVTLRCKTTEETQMWLKAINSHNKGTTNNA